MTMVVWIPRDLAAHLKYIIFNENSFALELFAVALAFAIFWFVAFYIVKNIIRPLVHNKPWLREALERDYERSGKKMFEDLGIDFTKEEAIQFSMNDWPRVQAIYLQHIIGSLFCVPSLLGIGDPATTSSLAMCGILSEMGWEISDLAEIMFVRSCHKDGDKIWPRNLAFVMVLHHSLTMILGIPMILNYRSLKSLHWICFDLQFAGAMILIILEYTKLLDITEDRKQLRQFKTLNVIAFVTILWTRVFHWFYLIADMLSHFFNDGAWTFLVFGALLSAGFTLFSFEGGVRPFYKKLVKFHNASVEFEALPANASASTRRSSVVKLEKAMAELLAEDEMKEFTDFLDKVFVDRKVSRRQTLQPTNMRRRSLVTMLSKSKSVMHVLQEEDKKEL